MYKNRIRVLVALIAVFFSMLAGEVVHADTGGTALEIFVANTSPNPVEPGQDFLVNIIVRNSGTADAINANATFNAPYPFTMKTVQNDITGKNICSGCSNSIIYALSVDPAAVSGSYPVEFDVSYGSGNVRIQNKKAVTINVVGIPQIVFEGNTSGKIMPKSRFGVDFTFSNIGTGHAKNLKVSTKSSDFVIAGGAPVISSLQAGESKTLTVTFISGPDVLPNVYSIPITLSYTDELGAPKEATSDFGVSLLGNSDLTVKNVKIEPMPVSPGNDFTLTVRVQNIGYGDAREVVMELDAPYSGYKKAFIGKLGKDEDAPAIFNLVADSRSSNAVLTMKYSDDFGEHEKTEDISVNVAETRGSTIYYSLAVAAIALAVIYRKKMQKALGG